MIIPVHKPIGASTHQLAQAVGSLYGEKATHTGTLDPLAEGVVVVLTGEDRYRKADFGDWQKCYQFDVLFGINTDSLDLLGIPSDGEMRIPPAEVDAATIRQILPSLRGTYQQEIPHFSAKRIAGKSYFDLAKNGLPLPQHAESITIFSLELISLKNVALEQLLLEIKHKLTLVTGDFRQEIIAAAWEKIFDTLKERGISSLPVARLESTTSKRTYIRALVRDLGVSIDIPATTASIVRTKNGPYQLSDCTSLNGIT